MSTSGSNGAGSSAAAPYADAAAAADAVRAIASLAPAALPHLVGHARLAATLHQALATLATHALLASAAAAPHAAALQPLAVLLRRTQTQGDPSLVRALLPGTPPLLALLVAAHGTVRRPLLRRLLRHPVEAHEGDELLAAAAQALQAALAGAASERVTHVARASHVVAALCAALPLASIKSHAATLAPLLEQAYIEVQGTSSDSVRAQAHLLDAAADVRAANGASLSGELGKAANAGARPETWTDALQQTRSSARGSAAAAAASGPSKETLDALTSLLPHLQREPLRNRLAAPRYSGKGIEELTSMLLDEGDDEPPAQDLSPPPPAATAKPAPAADEGTSATRARFNFDPSRLRFAGQRDKDDEGLSSELKRLTLARAEAPESDEEDDLGRELDAVGFEEELDIEAPQDRRHGISTLVGARADARSYAAGAEDVSDEEDGALRSAPATRPGSTAASRAATPDPRARVEEILRRAWLVHGQGAFARDERARQSAVRKDMLAQLGSGWDNALVEDWAVVFERNPKRDAILSRLAMSVAPQPARAASPSGTDEDDGTPRFGPDRGRGGRLPRGGGRGGSAGRGGAPSSGRGGGHSGNDRARKAKEKAGSARSRGHDRKAARGHAPS